MSGPRALFVGANAEEYGSDRMLLHSIDAVRDVVEPVVLLPRRGPLADRLRASGIATIVVDDFALRRTTLTARAVGPLIANNVAAGRRIAQLQRGRDFRFVYSNTQTVVVGAFMARALRIAHVWHVHEIFREPAVLARPLAQSVAWSRGRVVACSTSVKEALVDGAPRLGPRVDVVLNGVDLAPDALPYEPRDDVVRLGCVARIHPRKGQELLVRALALLVHEKPHVGKVLEVHCFGAPFPGQEHLARGLEHLARDLGVGDQVQMHGFVSDPASIYPTIDVLVLPSVEPEPFGLVCVEAMGFGRVVIAPAEAGPTEIVDDGHTGVLFEPRAARSLAAAIERVVVEPEHARRVAAAGRVRAVERFGVTRYHRDIRDVVLRTAGMSAQ